MEHCRQCPIEIWPRSSQHCIFHAKLEDKRTAESQREFSKAIADKVASEEATDSPFHDFYGYVFPDGFDLFGHKKFKKPVNFIEARFGNKVSFAHAHFLDDTRFERAIFGDEIAFYYARFGSETNFQRAEFGDGVIFSNASFGDGTNFSYATFGKAVYFPRAAFGSQARFRNCFFGGRTDFHGVRFGAMAFFHGTKFMGNARFESANFGDAAAFICSLFGKNASFVGVQFEGRIKFEGEDRAEDGGCVFQEDVDFRKAVFLKPDQAVFYKVNLSRAFVSEVFNLEKVRFWDVRWGKTGDTCAVYDELGATSKIDSAVIAQTYRQLWKNYDEYLEYHTAGDFHVGSMRMKETYLRKRLSSANVGLWHKGRALFVLIVNRLYRSVSNYGERYGKALAWLLFSWVSWTMVYWILSDWENLWAGEPLLLRLMRTLLESVVDSLRVVTFQRWRSNLMDDWRYGLVASFQTLTTLPLVALFLLALKRRFRR